ncbi:MAG: hypothetical protein IKH88_09260 [Prevotella sp.]|nr:hypothetical protein [Prevotella sp.]
MTLTNFLLDIAPDPGSHWTPRHPHIIKPEVVEDNFTQAKDSFLIVRDSLLNLEKQATDTVSNMQSSGVVGGGDDSSSLLLTVLVVMAALALCVTLAVTYRRRLSHA